MTDINSQPQSPPQEEEEGEVSKTSSSSRNPEHHEEKNVGGAEKEEEEEEESGRDDEPQPKKDDEGLLLNYDVIVCGTGLVQSIVSSACVRAGKSVLHCDGSDIYGELDAVWNLDSIDNNKCSNCNTTRIQKQEEGQELQQDTLRTEVLPVHLDSTQMIPLSSKCGTSSLIFHSNEKSQQQQRNNEESRNKVQVGTKVQTPDGQGTVQELSLPSISSVNDDDDIENIDKEKKDAADNKITAGKIGIMLDSRKLEEAEGEGEIPESQPLSNMVYYDIDMNNNKYNKIEDYLFDTHQIRSLHAINVETILKNQQRYFALDATPAFVLASGRAVQGMLASNVADYLEFKTIDGLYWLDDDSSKKDKDIISRVPCNKSDVFTTKLLKPMDKRRLMKFLQLTMDYATQLSAAEEMMLLTKKKPPNSIESSESEGIHRDGGGGGGDDDDVAKNKATEATDAGTGENDEVVQSLNERHLNQGRSLARPQNKAVATEELKILHQCMTIEDNNNNTKKEMMTFDEYLEKHHKLSPKLRALVRYALALETQSNSISLSQGMSNLRHHLQAMGRYGSTAFLVPMYGSGELSQAFCRSAAVFGATYLLRRSPIGIQLQQPDVKKTEGQRDGNDDDDARLGVWISGDPSSEEYSGSIASSSRKEKMIRCNDVVLPIDALPSPIEKQKESTSTCTTRCQRILRRISILTGKLIVSTDDNNKNNEQRHVIFIPPHTIGNSHVIHCVTLDDSTQVTPPGCTMLHMTTTISVSSENDDDDDDAAMTDLLDKTFDMVVNAKQSQDPIDEIYSVTFSHNLHTPSSSDDDDSTQDNLQSSSNSKGIHVCHHTGQVLTADVAFEQAQKIFNKICPGKEFLGLSDELDAKIKERAVERGYVDDERLMLESALDMIGGGTAAEATPSSDDEAKQEASDARNKDGVSETGPKNAQG